MCGISGLIALRANVRVTTQDLTRMTDCMVHRGPDGAGVWVEANSRAGLAHRRLSIIDLDERANQPMADASGRVHVTFNGEIYNHQELRREIEAVGGRFLTDHSDTEVLIQGYLFWGLERLLQRMDGMFAFALYDSEEDRLFLIRDRIGIKPLYFTEHNGLLAFASEIKALLSLPGLPRRLDRSASLHYLSFLTSPAPATLFDGIAKLPAGHFLTIGPNRTPTTHRYWNPAEFAARAENGGECEAPLGASVAGETRKLIEAAVESHMVADVPVGVFLSGGIDSSTILALMSRFSNNPVRSFTVGFSDHPELNEFEEARTAARRHQSEHHEIQIKESDATEFLEDLVHHQDEPIADWVCVPLYFVAKLAHSIGTKAVLVGEGADELFHGYQSYSNFLSLHDRMRTLRRVLPAGLGSAIAPITRLLPNARMGLIGLLDHIRRGISGEETFWTGAIGYWDMQKERILGERDMLQPAGWPAYGLRTPAMDQTGSGGIIRDLRSGLHRQNTAVGEHTAMTTVELSLRLPELLLMRADKMTMAHSVEARVPFLDHHLVEFVLGLNRETVLPAGQAKGLLKAAVAGLIPEETLLQPKKGFGAPMATWLRSEFGRHAEQLVLSSHVLDDAGLDKTAISHLFTAHREGRRDLSLFIWPLINLAAWYDYWIEGAPK